MAGPGMSEIDKIKRIVEMAVKADRPRRAVVDRLLFHIVEGDAAGFVETFDLEHPSSGEMLRVISRYGRALRDLKTR